MIQQTQNKCELKDYNGNVTTVHIKELRPYVLNGIDAPEEIALRDKRLFNVEAILRHRTPNNKSLHQRNKTTAKFLVKWEGYDESKNSWVPWSDLLYNTTLQAYLTSIRCQHLIPKSVMPN